MLLIIAIVGTTVAPWQLFFQQSNIIDKRITPRWINYERLDTYIGAVVVVLGAAALIASRRSRFSGTPLLRPLHRRRAGPPLGSITRSVGGGGVLRDRAAERFADRRRRADAVHQLRVRRRIRDQELAAPQASPTPRLLRHLRALIVGAAAIVLIPGAPLGVITEAVQALAGVLLPSASVFLLLLCNDREVLGPWCNPPWLNVLASVIVAVLVLLSLILMATTVFPSIDVTTVALVGGGDASRSGCSPSALVACVSRASTVPWPRSRPTRSRGRSGRCRRWRCWRAEVVTGAQVAMLALRGYLLVSVILLIVKAVQLGGG